MAEGPQVLRRTEWLDRYLAGRRILRSQSQRDDIPAEVLRGLVITRTFCKGKNIFIELDEGHVLHNHLLMRGKWKKLSGAQLFLPFGAWLGLDVGQYTVCNIGGQRLRLIDHDEVEKQLSALGPDAMAKPYPAEAIRERFVNCDLPICEALLQQSILAGVGNIAKSEILFTAGLAPQYSARELSDEQVSRLIDAIHTVLWNSYHRGGRWDCRVYRRDEKPCEHCGTTIVSLAMRPSKRLTFYCPRCQADPS